MLRSSLPYLRSLGGGSMPGSKSFQFCFQFKISVSLGSVLANHLDVAHSKYTGPRTTDILRLADTEEREDFPPTYES